MKSTIVLFISAIVLTTIVYFVEEKGSEIQKVANEKKYMLFDPAELGEMRGFSGPNFNVVLEGTNYFSVNPKKRVDVQNVDAFFNEISGLRVKRVLSEEEIKDLDLKLIFPFDEKLFLKFTFEKKNLDFYLGKKLDFDQTFYMKMKDESSEKFVIVEDSRPMDEVYLQTEAHRADGKYRKFKALVELDQSFFYDLRLFKRENYPLFESIDKIVVESFRNRNFTILVQENSTDPAPPPGINIDLESMNDNFQKILGLRGQALLPRSKAALDKKSEISIESGNKIFKMQLFFDPKSKNYLARTEDEDLDFLMEQADVLPFFKPVQEYWNMSLPILGDQKIRMIFPQTEVTFVLPEKVEEYCIQDKNQNSRVIKQRACTKFNRWIRQKAMLVTFRSPLTKQITWSFEIEINSKIYAIGYLNQEGFVWDRASDLLYTFNEVVALRDRDILL